MGVKERYEERQKNGEKNSYSGVRERSVAKEIDGVASSITNRVNTWLENHNNYITNYQTRNSGRKYNYEDSYVSDSADWLNTISKQRSNFSAEADSILAQLDQYKDYLDADWMDNIRNTLSDARNTQSIILDDATNDNEWWNSFGSEDLVKQYGSAENAYKASQRYDGYRQKYSGMKYDDIQKALETFETNRSSEIAELESALSQYKELSRWEQDEKGKTALENLSKKYGSIEDLENTIKTKKLASISEEEQWLIYNQDELYKNDSTYTSKAASGFKSYEAQKIAEAEQEANKTWWDKAADFVIDTFGPNNYDNPMLDSMMDQRELYVEDTSWREPNDEWSTEQKNRFGYLWTEDREKAYAYAEQVNNQINAEKKYLQQQDIGNWASKDVSNNIFNPLGTSGKLGTLGAVASAPFAMGDFVDDLIEYSARGTITQKNTLSPFEMGQAAQSGIANKLNGVDENGVAQRLLPEAIPIIGGKGWGDIYSLGVSTANSMLSALAFGGVGTLVNFIGQGGAAGVDDALSRGATAEQALLYGTIVGSLEGLTEMIPAEQLIKAGSSATFKNYIKKALQQSVGEFFEEGASSFFGNLADDLIMKDKSNYNIMVKELMEKNPGMTAEEASSIAFKQMAEDVAFDAIGGALSGFTSGAVTGAGATAIDSFKYNQKNIDAVNDYGHKTDALIQEGLQSDKKSESYQLAEKYKKQVEGKEGKKGKELTGFQIRNLLAANQEQAVKNTQTFVKDQLKELGENTSEIYTLAEIITKKVSGQELTRSEKSTLARSQYGAQVAKEMTDAKELAAALIKAAKESSTANKSLTDRVGEESNLSVSEDGQTKIRDTDEAFDIKSAEVGTIADGQMTFKVSEDREVSAEDIDWADEDTAYLVSAISHIENITPGDATVLIHAYDASSGQSVAEYVNGIDEAFTYGYNKYSEADMGAGKFAQNLSNEQMMSAYKLGQTARSVSKTAKTDAIKKMRTAVDAEVEKLIAEGKAVSKGKMTITYNAGNGNVVDFDKAGVKMTTKQKAAPALAKVMHEMGLGTNFELFSSYLSKTLKDEDGNRVRVFLNDMGEEEVAYSGVYRMKDGTIRIDLNAYNGRGLTLDAMSHELTHFIQQWSGEKYEILADFLVKTYEKTDMSMHDRVLREQARLERIRKKEVSYSEAYDEVVANAMSKMLADGKVMERLQELKAQDMNLAEKLWEGLKKLLTKFFRIYEKEAALFHDAADLMELKAEFEQMQKMWADAFLEASDNFQMNLMATEIGVEPVAVEDVSQYSYSSLAEAAGFVAVQNEDGTRSFTRDGKKVSEVTVEDIENSPIGAFINFSVEMNDITADDAKRQKQMFADICTMACKTNDFAMTMQFVGSAVFTGMKANADKQYGTTYDFPSICTKTQAVIDAMSAKMKSLGRGLTSDEIVQLYADVFATGNPVPCPECYVFSRWIGIGGLLDNIKKYQDYYGDMDVKDVADAYLKMKAEVSKFAEEQGISFGKAKGAMTSKFTKEFNNLTEKIEKQENQGEKVKASDRKRLAELEPMMNTVKAMTWLENVYFADSSLKKVNPNFRVPNDVLFDLNNGEAFATQYKEAWAFRTTQGAGYGKAITPYAEARLGEGVLVTNNTTNAIKGRAQGTLNNYFLNQKGKLDKQSRDALKRARMKQKIQAFIGGQRFQSTSDARYENASDYLLAALEMQAMGGMVQAYTKVDGAIPAFSAWGFSSNQSLMPLNGGLDADGNVQDTPVGGMKPSVAFENRNKHESAGTITIGVNDNHIRAMFQQWVRDFIIPYHASGGKADVVAEFRRIQEGKKEDEVETVRSTDYSRTQSDKILSDDVLRWQGKTDAQIQRIHEVRAARIAILTGGKPNMTVVRSNRFLSALYDKLNGGEWDGVKLAKSKVESQIFPNEFWDQTVTYEESAKITKDYLEYCEDLGFLHRFSGTVPSNGRLVPVNGYNENGERVQLTDLAYKYDENGNKTAEVEEFFWKVLTDRRMYDNNGNYLPQKVVTLNDTTAETVTGFAKNNQGRQYDKAKAEALAQKIVSGQYSSQQTDVDTNADSAYDSAKKETKQEDKADVTREETREAFHRRAHEKEYTVRERGKTACGYTPVVNQTERAGRTEKELKKLGIQVIVHEGLEANVNGVTKVIFGDSTSVAGDAVYVRNSMKTDPMETAGHEAYHFWKHTDARLKYKETVVDNIVFSSDAFIQFQKKIADAYFGEEVGIVDDGADKLEEEIFAYITGLIHAGDSKNIVRPFMRDYDAVKASWDDLIKKQAVIYDLKGEDLARKNAIGTARYSTQETDNISNRHLLANAFEGITNGSEEYKLIQRYKGYIAELNSLEAKLSEFNQQILKIRFGKGEYDAEKLARLEDEAGKIAEAINKYDQYLLSLEASEPLRKVIARERKKEAQKTKDHVKEIQQNKKVRAEQTELRHKIRKTIRDLDKLLNHGNKKTNVKEDMKSFASKALELADYLFTDHISNDDLIRKGITVRMTEKEAALVKETEDILSQLYDHADSLTDEEFTRLDAKRKANEDKLRDLLKAQRNERLNTPVYNLFNDLVTEYASLKNSKQDSVKAAYDEVLENSLRAFMGDEDRVKILKNMRVADMTTEELNWLYRAYTMVLTNVRNANKFHVKGITETIEQRVGRIAGDFSSRKIPDKKAAIIARNLANKIGWDYEKLYYALDRIGSEAFTELVMNIANSENTVMQDVMEAAAFRDEMVKEYGFNNWDVNKEIDREFLDNTGKKFKLTLGQLMALYAYSRREGAWDHIAYGGFVFGEAALTNPRPADSYKLSKEQCEAITSLLTEKQRGYAEAMQKYLSETMGEKGNEVSMMLYGIKMFGEKNYFPIHIAGQFKAQANESQAKAAAGFSSMSNAGFTHAQNPNAKAPFVLEGFNEIWVDHVNEMSRYHGTVPALEDMRRVMNRSSYSESGMESMAIKQLMENSYGKEAVEYFDNLYREANSGAITDKLQKNSKKLLSLFRKNSVAYSLSVLIQQPAAMVRAYDLIDRKYFGFKGFGTLTSGIAKAVSDKWTKAHTNAYNEMLKYAPGVTMAKEIGGFDTATGGSIRSYLLDTNKSLSQKWKTGTAIEKGSAVMDLVDNNAVANLPNLADKIAWIEIWNACKRETVAKHKDLATNSEEFMQAVGERFTEVIRATQVYDSIFAKSPMLKSKNLAVQYLVSFMNEPNTVANMVEKAVRDATKGDWKSGAKTAAVVVHSIIFTNVLKSLVYAMRDEDEDETYIEKYIEAVAGNMMSDFNALNYIPIARDVVSLAQGYDVERADMAIVADALDALNRVIKNGFTETDDMTEEQLVEFDKKCTEANWKLVESVAAFFGIPVKNIRREIEGVINTAKNTAANNGQTTLLSAWEKVYDAVIESIPFMQVKNTKQDKLYEAIMAGDQAYLSRLKSTYKDDTAYDNAVIKALREKDPRIHEAAQAGVNGNSDERNRIYREIKAELGAEYANYIIQAINNESNDIRNDAKPDKVKEQYGVHDFVEAVSADDAETAKVVRDDIIQTYVDNGKTPEEAEKAFVSDVKDGIEEAYSYGELSKAVAENMLVEYADMDEEDAASRVNYWAFLNDHSEHDQYKLSESNVNKYLEFAEPAGISMDVFVQFRDRTKGLSNIKDKWGDVEKSVRDQTIDVIHSLPLTRQQKDALYLAAELAESRIWDVPW